MALSEQQIRQLTDEIVKSLSGIRPAGEPCCAARRCAYCRKHSAGCCPFLFDTADQAVAAAKAAQQKLQELTLEMRGKMIAAMRETAIRHAESLARLAHEETGYGNVDHKVQKNLLVARR